MEWKLKPYESLGPIDLGMQPVQIAEVLGPATRQRKLPSGKIREGRGINMPSIIYKDFHVVEIELFPDAGDVYYGDLHFFDKNVEAVRRTIFEKDSDVFEGAGGLVFFGLGISTTLFHQVETPSLAAFAKGNWDNLMHLLKPFSASSRLGF